MYVHGYLQGSENGRVVTIASNSPHLFANSLHYQIGQLAPREFLYYKANNISKIQIANSPHFYLISSFYPWMFTECKCWIKDVCQLAALDFLYYTGNNVSKNQVTNSPHFHLVNSFNLSMFICNSCHTAAPPASDGQNYDIQHTDNL